MARVFSLLFSLTLAACGGSGNTAAPSIAPPAPAAATLSGVAATGAAIIGHISLKDATGRELSLDTANGQYTFTLTGLTAPFMLRARWISNGATETLYSFATSPTGGTANITALTNVAVVAAAGTELLDGVYDAGNASAFSTIAAALPAAVTQVQDSFASLLAKQGVAGVNPITGVFAADHTGMDAVLDGISVTYVSGNLTVIDKTGGAIVLEAPIADMSHAVTLADWSAQDAAAAADPEVVVAANGSGLVVWSETVGAHSAIRARFLLGNSGAAVTLSTAGDAGLPKIAIDAVGDAIVVWTQYENARNDIWASRYAATARTWSMPIRISASSAVADANVPDAAVDDAGNAVVVWHQGDGRTNHFDVWSARYTAATDLWTAPALASDGVNSAYNPHVAVNGAGQGLAAWVQQQGDGTTVSNGPQDIWGRFASTGTWGTGSRLNGVAGDVDWVYGQVAVALDSQGHGFALWVQGSGVLPFVVHAARFAGASGWQPSAVITSNALDNCYGPHLAFDSTGNAVAVWQQQTGTGAYGGVNRFDIASGWGTSGAIGNDVAGDVYDPHVAIDGAGNATAVWYQWDTSGNQTNTINVMSNRSLAGGAWGSSRLVSAAPSGGLTYPVPRVAANAMGQTLLVWGSDSY